MDRKISFVRWFGSGEAIEDLLRTRTAERNALLDRVQAVLAADKRLDAGWLLGSVGRGEEDGFSDLDVAVVVDDDVLSEVAGGPERPATYRAVESSPRARFGAEVAEPMLVVEAPQNAPPGGAFLSTFIPGVHGPHGIDWLWQPRSIARRPTDTCVLFDRRKVSSRAEPGPKNRGTVSDEGSRSPLEASVRAACSFWAMLLWSAKGVARLPDAPTMPLLRHADDCLRRIDEAAGTGPVQIPSGSISGGFAKLRLLRAYADRMEQWGPRLQEAGIVLPAQVPDQVDRLLDVAAAAVRARSQATRRC